MSEYAEYVPGARRNAPLSPGDGRVIRPAEKADLPAIARVAAERENESPEKWLAIFERVHNECAEGRSFLVLAELQGEVAAYGKIAYFEPQAESPPNVAPAGWYLGGVVVRPADRRRGLGRQLTRGRLAWIAQRDGRAYYFANARNRVSIELHREFGFRELTRDFFFPGATFDGGTGVLFVCDLPLPEE